MALLLGNEVVQVAGFVGAATRLKMRYKIYYFRFKTILALLFKLENDFVHSLCI